MALPASGPISGSQIGTELGLSSPYSLHNMSLSASFSTPDAMSDFYGYTPPTSYYTWEISYGLNDPSIYGCDNSGPFPTTVYSSNSSFPFALQFFNDTSLTSPFNGGNYWYTNSTFENGMEIQIDSSGNNVNAYSC
jgi:hypothetical protein